MDIKELADPNRFILLLKLPHSEVLSFVQDEFSSRTPLIRLFIGLNILLVLFMIALAIYHLFEKEILWWQLLSQFFLGVLATITLLVPIHEGLHGLAYKLVGATKVNFGANWRQFYFYATADHFIVGIRKIWLIALTPFFVINGIAVLATFWASISLQWFIFGILLMHTNACAGDFAMLNYFVRQKDKKIYSYDDVPNKVSYFFEQIEE